MATPDQPRIVVTGASGKVGAHDRRRSSRRTACRRPCSCATPRGHPSCRARDVVVADFTDGASVRAALRPGDRVFMVSVHEDVETRIAAHQSFVDAAAEVGIGLLAYLSIVNPVADLGASRTAARTTRPSR